MSHWAELDENNIVVRVLVGDNNDPEGDEGYKWLVDNLGGTWVKTSYNASIRYNYAGVGYRFDPTAEPDGAFISPACHDEAVLNENYSWECSNAEHEAN